MGSDADERSGGRATGRDRSQHAISEALYARRKALADLMHSLSLRDGDLDRAIRQITETAADVLGVERASVWRLTEGGQAIECVDLFERTPPRHSAGTRIVATDVPRYFEALRHERSLAAHDARVDSRTSEFTASYLVPNRITAMLDAPVFVRGQMIGVVCHEHVGSPRTWEFFEELLAATFADFVALVLETADWRRAEDALRDERDQLESKVAARTSELRDSEANLRSLLDLSPIAMVLSSASDGKVVYVNQRAAELFDVPIEEAQRHSTPDFWAVPADRERFVTELTGSGRVDGLEVELRSHRGRTFWCRMSVQRLRFAGDDTLLAAMVDITEQRLAEARLRDQANHDDLTGLFNRRHLEEVLRGELERARRYGRPLAVALLDVDHFKRVNDGHGHLVGDQVLRELAKRCGAALRTTDVLGRYGGEEFIVVFPETDSGAASVVAERMRRAVAEPPMQVGELALELTASIGIAALRPGEELVALLGRADAALYAAKQAGRDRVVVAADDAVAAPLLVGR
ncbi:MAG: Diguanylate cyclase/phosphodiesterase domain 1 [Deltaproteobacteria bacterium]|nr:Diguanylate cyclase/phosphodiesterase domain 1 [Deltaproteobacteria bacterium]